MLTEMIPFAKALKDDKDSTRSAVFSAAGGLLTIFTGDMRFNHYAERTVDATVLEEGKAGVDIKQAMDVLSVIDTEVTLEIKDGGSGSVTSNKTNLLLRGSVDPIMKLTAPKTGWVTVDRAENLISAAQIADRCRRQDNDLQYDIDGLCLLPTPNGIELVGTDGNHLISVATGVANCVDKLTVCQPHLAKALSFFDKKEPVSMAVVESCIWLKQGGRLNVIGRMQGNNFRDYHEILDPTPIYLGTLSFDDSTKVVGLIKRKVLEPTAQGLVRLVGSDDTLYIYGKYAKHTYACHIPNINLMPVACNGDGFSRMLSMFDAGVELYWGKNEEHLYLKQGSKTAIIGLEEDFFPDNK